MSCLRPLRALRRQSCESLQHTRKFLCLLIVQAHLVIHKKRNGLVIERKKGRYQGYTRAMMKAYDQLPRMMK